MFNKKIGIDLGTANTLVVTPKKGLIINEPTVVAVSVAENKILAVGLEAKEMIGRTPDEIVASRPLRDGVIADYRMTEAMLRYFINKAMAGVRLFRPEVMIAVPAGITSTERRAVIDAASQAGAKAVYLIKEPIAAAIGAGIPIGESHGNMIVDVGGGTAEIAIISLGGIVVSNSIRMAGNKMDAAIADYIKGRFNLAIGDQTAEEIKIKIGSVWPKSKNLNLEIRGRDMLGGLPKTINITTENVMEPLTEIAHDIVRAIKSVLQRTPPELAADVIDRGMVLSGGGSLLRGLDKLISKEVGVTCFVADDPLLCVVRGTGVALENLDSYKQGLAK